MSWECPRCRTIHSDLTPSCNCPPPTSTSSSTAVPGVVPVPAFSKPVLEGQLERKLRDLGETKLMQFTNALESFHGSLEVFENFFSSHYCNSEESMRLLAEATSWFDLLCCRVMDIVLIHELERPSKEEAGLDVDRFRGKRCPKCQKFQPWDPNKWANIDRGKGVLYACPDCVEAQFRKAKA